MNLINIACNDLKNFLIQKKYIFFILIIGLIVASYSFSFFTAQSLHIMELINDYFNYSTKYYISGNGNILDYKKINYILNYIKENKLKNEKINIYSEIFLVNETDSKDEHNEFQIIVGTNNTKSNRVDFVGEEMTEQDILNKTNYLMIEYYSEEAENDVFILNNDIDILGRTYNVKAIDKINVDRHIYSDCNIKKQYINDYESHLTPMAISYTTFMDAGYEIYAFEIIFEQPLNEEQKNNFEETLYKYFGNNTIIKPVETGNNNIIQIKEELIKYELIILLALINILALFVYWVDKNWRKFTIYKLCGAKNIDIYFLIIIEAMIISIFTNLIGIILYYITVPLLQKIYISYVLSFKEIIYIQSIITILVFVLININVVQIFKRNVRFNERR